MNNYMLITLLDFIQRTNVMVALILTALGVALAILAKRITKAIRGVDKVKEEDAVFVGFKVVGLLLILVGLILMVIEF